jgi:hypothetical protein
MSGGYPSWETLPETWEGWTAWGDPDERGSDTEAPPVGANTWEGLPATWDRWTIWDSDAVLPPPPPTPGDKVAAAETPVLDVGDVQAVEVWVDEEFDGGEAVVTGRWSIDGRNWNDWSEIPSIIRARYVQVRLALSGEYPIGKEFRVTLVAAERSFFRRGIDTATLTGPERIGAGDVRLRQRRLASVDYVGVTVRASGYTASVIDYDASVGPRVQIRDASGALADAVIDVMFGGA